MRVIGIDPGTRHLGWGVLHSVGTRIEHVAHGVIDTDEKTSLASRLVEIDDALERILAVGRQFGEDRRHPVGPWVFLVAGAYRDRHHCPQRAVRQRIVGQQVLA